MAAWSQNVSLTAPAGLDGLVSGLGTLATAAGTTLDASEAALNAAKVFLQGTFSPQAAAASALVTQTRAITNDLFRAGLNPLTRLTFAQITDKIPSRVEQRQTHFPG